MAKAAESNGVKYISGDAGHVRQLTYGENKKCTGAVTADGTMYRADIVVLAAGANTATLVDIGQEVEAQCSVICVIRLEPEEVNRYREMPVIMNLEQGIVRIFPKSVMASQLNQSRHSLSSQRGWPNQGVQSPIDHQLL